jgi:hypothetical protein
MKWYTPTEHFSIIVCILMLLWMFRTVLHLYQHVSSHTGYIYCWHSLVNLKIKKLSQDILELPHFAYCMSVMTGDGQCPHYFRHSQQHTQCKLLSYHMHMFYFIVSLLAVTARHRWRMWSYKCCRRLSAWLSEECKTKEQAPPWSNLLHIDFWVLYQRYVSNGFLELHYTAIIIIL